MASSMPLKTFNSGSQHQLFDDVLEYTSAKTADHDLQYLTALRAAHPDLIVTTIPQNNVPLLAFAGAGYATYEVDKETDSYAAWRGYVGPSAATRTGAVAEAIHFAKYHYIWNNEDFILYNVNGLQYVLKERKGSEHPFGPSRTTDELIKAVGSWLLDGVVWVYDNYWFQDKKLFQEVKKSSWDKVILDEGMKKEISETAEKFFDSKDVYDDLGVPWKRGLLFHGPPGNGKTISIKALMRTLLLDRKHPIPTLYVRSAKYTYNINDVFRQARNLAPCMLILEDIETIVTAQTRSYFFNQMDGLEDNSGLFVVGSTNYLDRLDPGLTSRPSRFDRKYLFPLPNKHERTLYCQYWQRKMAHKPDIKFPDKLCPAMASITDGFSFAFLQEAFVASLLYIAHEAGKAAKDDDDVEKYQLWRVFKKQVDTLRKEMRNEKTPSPEGETADSWPVSDDQVFQGFEDVTDGGRTRQVRNGMVMTGENERGICHAFGQLDLRSSDEEVVTLPYSKGQFINSVAFAQGLNNIV